MGSHSDGDFKQTWSVLLCYFIIIIRFSSFYATDLLFALYVVKIHIYNIIYNIIYIIYNIIYIIYNI